MGALQGRARQPKIKHREPEKMESHPFARLYNWWNGLYNRYDVCYLQVHHLPITDITFRSPESYYKLHGGERDQYERTLVALARVVPLWPPVPSLRMAAQKWNTIKILEMAALANNWSRPRTDIMHPACDIPADTVLKRSHSECGEQVLMPEQSAVGSGGAVDRIRKNLNATRTWSKLNARTHSTDQKWASQEYIETLITIGEWRFFLVGGHVENIVHTIKGKDGLWIGRRVSSFLSFHELR